MAKKSKTQRAKASANRAAKKDAVEQGVLSAKEETEVKSFFAKREDKKEEKQKQTNLQDYQIKEEETKAKTNRFQFFIDVRSEMRRVTWPSRQDVLQWTGVVVVALIFFGLYTLVLDDWVVTPLLYAISSLGA